MFEKFKDAINELANEIHSGNVKAGWWRDLSYPKKVAKLKALGYDDAAIQAICESVDLTETLHGKVVPEKLCLSHSELSEAMEGHRKGLMDDKLPHRTMFEVELADAVIRIFDLAGSENLDLGGAIVEKLSYNSVREDHKIENRVKDGGKAY